MTVRAKFRCVKIEGNPDWKTIKLEAVIDGSEENKAFFRMTPSGSITIGCVNPEANKQFEEGAEYFVDFSLVKPLTNLDNLEPLGPEVITQEVQGPIKAPITRPASAESIVANPLEVAVPKPYFTPKPV